MNSLQALAEQWRKEADVLRKSACEPQAVFVERHIAELEQAARAQNDVTLPLDEAARESGYSSDHLRHLVAAGRIANAGRKGAPRVRRGDLPRKAPTQSAFDPNVAARRALSKTNKRQKQ